MESLRFLSEYGYIAGPLLILLMLAESAPVIGFLIPGALVLPALGAMTGSGVWSFWPMYACAATGALLGDLLGYWLGRTGAEEWSGPLFRGRRRRAVEAARKLVHERGALAIVLGRFAWLIHPAVPPAIGFLELRLRTFVLIDAPTVGLWVLLYMGLGHLVTGMWVRQTVEVIEMLSLLLILVVILLLRRRLARRVQRRPAPR